MHRGGGPGFAAGFHAGRHHGGFRLGYGYPGYGSYGYDGCDTPYGWRHRWRRPAYCY
jgi:hypothetical protein